MKVEYVDHLGDDLRVVNAARVSFDKESEWETDWDGKFDEQGLFFEKTLSQKDRKLINYLATHGHWTPFSHVMITVRETVPIFVARQRFKHMVGFTYNEVSRRYVDDEPEFFVPDVWRSRPEGSVKQGSGSNLVEEVSGKDWFNYTLLTEDLYRDYLSVAKEVYTAMLEAGVAPEQARMVLPQSMYTSYYTTGSLAAFARAYKQRMDPHAQLEIQELATQWGDIIQPLFPVSWTALTEL